MNSATNIQSILANFWDRLLSGTLRLKQKRQATNAIPVRGRFKSTISVKTVQRIVHKHLTKQSSPSPVFPGRKCPSLCSIIKRD